MECYTNNIKLEPFLNIRGLFRLLWNEETDGAIIECKIHVGYREPLRWKLPSKGVNILLWTDFPHKYFVVQPLVFQIDAQGEYYFDALGYLSAHQVGYREKMPYTKAYRNVAEKDFLYPKLALFESNKGCVLLPRAEKNFSASEGVFFFYFPFKSICLDGKWLKRFWLKTSDPKWKNQQEYAHKIYSWMLESSSEEELKKRLESDSECEFTFESIFYEAEQNQNDGDKQVIQTTMAVPLEESPELQAMKYFHTGFKLDNFYEVEGSIWIASKEKNVCVCRLILESGKKFRVIKVTLDPTDSAMTYWNALEEKWIYEPITFMLDEEGYYTFDVAQWLEMHGISPKMRAYKDYQKYFKNLYLLSGSMIASERGFVTSYYNMISKWGHGAQIENQHYVECFMGKEKLEKVYCEQDGDYYVWFAGASSLLMKGYLLAKEYVEISDWSERGYLLITNAGRYEMKNKPQKGNYLNQWNDLAETTLKVEKFGEQTTFVVQAADKAVRRKMMQRALEAETLEELQQLKNLL